MEPASNTTAGIALATGAITITGSIVGLQFDALLFGLFGGLVSLMHLEPMSKFKMAGTLATASLMGAMGAPIVLAVELQYLAWLKVVSPDVLRLSGAFALGLAAQILIPLFLALVKRKGAAA